MEQLLAIVYSLKYYKQYMMGRHFKIRTDHAPLTWLRHTPDPIGQQERWLEVMEEFNFIVEHRPGVKHGNADVFSRRPCRLKSCAYLYSADKHTISIGMVKRFGFCEGSNFDHSHWTVMSPLTLCELLFAL